MKSLLFKRILIRFICLIIINFKMSAQSVTRLDRTSISFVSLDEKIKALMNAANVHGLAVSIFNNNQPVYKRTFVLP
jgi:D-alanyl-D-alanine-carboxypeptidase/D-alanyl-D-alanine-endopeptidase